MYSDPAGEDELHAGEADAVVWDLCELEDALGVCDVHHDLGLWATQGSRIDPRVLVVESTLVEAPDLPLTARYSDGIAGLGGLGGVLRTHDGGYPELAGHYGSVRGATAPVGDDGRSGLHDRLPVWVCDLRDKHLAALEALYLARVLEHPCLARRDRVAYSQALDEHPSPLLEAVHTQRRCTACSIHRLWAGLQDKERAREAISGPLDVHECSGPAFLAVVILDGHGPPRELEHVLIGGRERLSLLFGGRNVLDQTMAPGVVDQLELLRAEPLPDQRGVALFERGLVNVEAIRDDTALDDVLAKPPRRSYEHDVWEARLGVQGEDDAGGGQVRADHLLDTDREGYLKVVEAHVLAVADGARGKEAREAPLDRLYELCFSPNVKETLLLAREAGRWQVLSGCRRADGHVRVLFPVFIGEIAVATQDLRLQVFRYVTAQDQVLYQVASAGESLDIAAVKP